MESPETFWSQIAWDPFAAAIAAAQSNLLLRQSGGGGSRLGFREQPAT